VASATRGDTSLIAVVLDSTDMYGDATRLLDFGFASLG
jgi:D-alanyl-D-alanine carboxypeptidase